ncbi:Calcium-transporting ATPase 10, plasma membrane-type [Dendrobium catenatum]|uniref:Calcium-transporting ATPase 10, plasma membrane-type n=1 Tax=Dendrobium catenatum TaxID=906689 RepID=A0A2I0WQJ6_9ASPA|nr:Calcium-transporting ATPase 10, plasma membrane-type [Dendrobium catenatum]
MNKRTLFLSFLLDAEGLEAEGEGFRPCQVIKEATRSFSLRSNHGGNDGVAAVRNRRWVGPRVGVFSQTLSVLVEGLKAEGFRREAKESKKRLALSLCAQITPETMVWLRQARKKFGLPEKHNDHVVTAVGINIEWGLLMASISKGSGALEWCCCFTGIVTIMVVVVREGLPLAVTLILTYSMKKMMANKALMTVVEAHVGGVKLTSPDNGQELSSSVYSLLYDSIAWNASGNVYEPEAANDCDLEPIAYEFFTQAFILYEEEVVDSKAQVTEIHNYWNSVEDDECIGGCE